MQWCNKQECFPIRNSKWHKGSGICRKNNYLNEKVTRINFLLNLTCKEKGFLLIDNRSINIDDLWEDDFHLIEQWKVKSARKFIYFLNSFYWQPIYNLSPPEVVNLHTQTHDDIVNSNINKKISESISSSNPDKISADSSLNSIAWIRLCKSNSLNDFRKQNPDRKTISYLNVNSLGNKLEFLLPLVKDNIVILMMSETKLDSSFSHAQFSIEG